jgi:hypothetical protein
LSNACIAAIRLHALLSEDELLHMKEWGQLFYGVGEGKLSTAPDLIANTQRYKYFYGNPERHGQYHYFIIFEARIITLLPSGTSSAGELYVIKADR